MVNHLSNLDVFLHNLDRLSHATIRMHLRLFAAWQLAHKLNVGIQHLP